MFKFVKITLIREIMRYEIIKYGNPLLRTPCKDIEVGTNIDEIIINMWDTFKASKGIGISAPQCGLSINIFVFSDTTRSVEERIIVINPQILEYSETKSVQKEGCLSIPGIMENVTRSSIIKTKFFDENWQEHERIFSGLPATIFQHEFDHLNGKLFIDYLPSLVKKIISNKLKKIKKLK